MKSETILQNTYFIKHGERTGQFLVVVDHDKEKSTFSILGLPELECLYIKEEELFKHISNNMIDFVEKLPDGVFNDCKTQFLIAEKGK